MITEQEKAQLVNKISFHFEKILEALGQDTKSEGLSGTPERVAKYLIEFLLEYEPGNTDTTFEAMITDQMVIVRDIPFWSLCEHHAIFFSGKVSVAYLTGSRVIGLSKIPRIVQKHAHKLQLQERLAHDIADELEQLLSDSSGVAVLIRGEHNCMRARGIRSEGEMITSVVRGSFRDDKSARDEFLSLVK